MKYQGYCSDLSHLVGKWIEIPKGTQITNSLKGVHEAEKTYKVKVAMVMPGTTIQIGCLKDDGTPIYFGIRQRDLEMYAERLGVDDIRTLAYEKRSPDNNLIELYVDIDNPKVSWHGAHGYWSDADINDVTF